LQGICFKKKTGKYFPDNEIISACRENIALKAYKIARNARFQAQIRSPAEKME